MLTDPRMAELLADLEAMEAASRIIVGRHSATRP